MTGERRYQCLSIGNTLALPMISLVTAGLPSACPMASHHHHNHYEHALQHLSSHRIGVLSVCDYVWACDSQVCTYICVYPYAICLYMMHIYSYIDSYTPICTWYMVHGYIRTYVVI